ncbi:unnamed protein product [Phytomonas sp. EM1]|nr:unnamed protein product [Phytomonas sp. EM1]|eukprot:CCW60080.1 unnamed protein product [Phytomonas sp. isolate EM1]
MPASFKNKKLKNFSKHRREVRIPQSNEHGDGTGAQHHAQMRQIRNTLFENYYGKLQRLGESGAVPFEIHRQPHQDSLHRTTSDPSNSTGHAVHPAGHVLNSEGGASSTALERWDEEMMLFRTPLPVTFWINDTDPLASEVRDYLESLDHTMVEPIPWYPIKNMAWRVLGDKEALRKQSNMQALRRYMIRQTALGTISRQEEVSMIPPFLLDIQPTDVCLDMCASPGSKTAQMLVALGRHKVVSWDVDDPALPFPFDYASEGLIVANELDTKRANMLVHQVKRMQLLFPFALFTNHDARYFPDIVMEGNIRNKADLQRHSPLEEDSNVGSILRFDKVLCDVVCSGDGTLRKAPHIFKIWSPREAMSLQRIQIRIALRCCHLLKVGGRLVYSTCSLNPVENEAVVAQIIHRTNGSMKLVDARSLLPFLQCAPGLSTWVVTDAKGNVVERPSPSMHAALFPPNTPGGYHSPTVDAVDLSLCMRFLPSHCNGGGFFIAVLDKAREFRIEKRRVLEEEDSQSLSKEEGYTEGDKRVPATKPDVQGSATAYDVPLTETPSLKRERSEDCGEEVASSFSGSVLKERKKRIPPQFVQPLEVIHDTLLNFYKIEKFPEDLLIMRAPHGECEARAATSSICSIVSQTARRVLARKTDSLIVVSAGLRVFSFETLDKGWRIASEAAPLFARLMKESPRLLKVSLDFVKSMIYRGGKLKELALEDVEVVALREHLERIPLGTVLLEIDCPEAPNGVFFSVALRARTKIQLLVGHEDLPGLELRLGLEPRVEACESLFT